jgi:hypothetical protein
MLLADEVRHRGPHQLQGHDLVQGLDLPHISHRTRALLMSFTADSFPVGTRCLRPTGSVDTKIQRPPGLPGAWATEAYVPESHRRQAAFCP